MLQNQDVCILKGAIKNILFLGYPVDWYWQFFVSKIYVFSSNLLNSISKKFITQITTEVIGVDNQ